MDYLDIEKEKRKKYPAEFFMVRKENEKGRTVLFCIDCWVEHKKT